MALNWEKASPPLDFKSWHDLYTGEKSFYRKGMVQFDDGRVLLPQSYVEIAQKIRNMEVRLINYNDCIIIDDIR